MTARREFELSCDGPPGAGPFDCPTAPVFAKTIAEVREAAAHQGWVVVHRGSKVVDLCPDHKDTPRPPAVRGECAVCGRDYRVTLFGLLWAHKRPAAGSKWMKRCPGSGKPATGPEGATTDGGIT